LQRAWYVIRRRIRGTGHHDETHGHADEPRFIEWRWNLFAPTATYTERRAPASPRRRSAGQHADGLGLEHRIGDVVVRDRHWDRQPPT
jgi:hypothetical protein